MTIDHEHNMAFTIFDQQIPQLVNQKLMDKIQQKTYLVTIGLPFSIIFTNSN